MFDVACILEPIVIKIAEDLLSQNRKANGLPQIVVKLDGFDIEGVSVLLFTILR